MMSSASGIRIEPVETKSQREEFIELPYRLHSRRQYWVPPLRRDIRRLIDPKIHPFHRHSEAALFLARDSANGTVIGRAAAILNRRHNEFHKEQAGFIGFLDADDNREAFAALIEKVEQWLRERNCTIMRGPCSFSTNDECALLVEGYDRPVSIMIPYHPPYYKTHIEALGARKTVDLLSYYMVREDLTERLFRLSEAAAKRLSAKNRLTIRTLDMKNLDHEMKIVQDLYNRAWAGNWGFVPMTDEEIAFMAGDLKGIVDPRIVIIAELDGKPAGFSLAVPDFNIVLTHLGGRLGPLGILKALLLKPSIKTFRLMALGVDPDFRQRGLDVVLYGESTRRGLAAGYQEAEFSWILESNERMNSALKAIGASVIRRHRMYEWPLAE